MKNDFKRRFKKLIGILCLGFLLMFLFRLSYGYTKRVNSNPGYGQFFESISNTRKNYASKKYEMKSTSNSQSSVSVDQKYEKVAEVRTISNEFDSEEQKARDQVAKYKALIQFEQKSGNDGYRRLNLVIGVPPNNFDQLYNDLIEPMNTRN